MQYTDPVQIGKGQFGSVYRAEKDGKTIAVKVVSVKNKKILDIALEEVKFLENLSKCIPSVVCYYNSYIENQNLYIEMEYIRGDNLLNFSKKLKDNEKFSNHLMAIISDLIPGLQYLHSKSIIHRDIKPENIMIETSKMQPKLIDVGLACFFRYQTECENKTHDCCIGRAGTPYFMAPETLLYKKAYPESDVWSLGASIYFVKTDFYVFKPKMETFQAIKKEAENPIKLKTTGNIKLDILLSKMLDKNVKKRITTNEILKYLQ